MFDAISDCMAGKSPVIVGLLLLDLWRKTVLFIFHPREPRSSSNCYALQGIALYWPMEIRVPSSFVSFAHVGLIVASCLPTLLVSIYQRFPMG